MDKDESNGAAVVFVVSLIMISIGLWLLLGFAKAVLIVGIILFVLVIISLSGE